MTATYDLTTNIGKVRLLTGDKNIAAAVFTDEEIQSLLTDNANSVNLAAACVLESWASVYALKADSEHIGDYSYTQKIVANMTALAQKLRDKESNIPVADYAQPDMLFYGQPPLTNDEDSTSYGVMP